MQGAVICCAAMHFYTQDIARPTVTWGYFLNASGRGGIDNVWITCLSITCLLWCRAGSLYGELARFIFRLLGFKPKPKDMQLQPHQKPGAPAGKYRPGVSCVVMRFSVSSVSAVSPCRLCDVCCLAVSMWAVFRVVNALYIYRFCSYMLHIDRRSLNNTKVCLQYTRIVTWIKLSRHVNVVFDQELSMPCGYLLCPGNVPGMC